MKPKPLVYWDSCVFLYRLNRDVERFDAIEEVYQAAVAGRLVIVTFVITITEVLCSYDEQGTKHDQSQDFERFLRRSYFVVPELTRATARRAAELAGEYNLTSRDSVHLATCERANVTELHSYDGSGKKGHGKLLPLDGKLEVAGGSLRINEPRLPPWLEVAESGGSSEVGDTLFDATAEEPGDDVAG